MIVNYRALIEQCILVAVITFFCMLILFGCVAGMMLIVGILVGSSMGLVFGAILGGYIIYKKILCGLRGTWIQIFVRS